MQEFLNPLNVAHLVPPLLRAALTDSPPPLSSADILTELPLLLSWCEGQQLFSLVAEGILRVPDFSDTPESLPLIARMGAYAALSEVQLETALDLSCALEAARIEHMPLKGTLLKTLYPFPEWRSMGDIDILIHPEDRARVATLLSSMGCRAGVESDHEYHFLTREGVHIEMHKALVPTYDTDLYAYFKNGFFRTVPTEGWQYRMTLSPEDTYLYLVAHMAKHYRSGGVGVRYALDLSVFRRAYVLNESYLARELRVLGLSVFESCVRRLCEVWLEARSPDDQTHRMERYLFSGGVFGDPCRAALSEGARLSRKGSKAKRARRRRLFFPSYETMCRHGYRGARWRLPLWWMERWWTGITAKRAHSLDKLSHLALLTDESVDAWTDELAAVGLSLPPRRSAREQKKATYLRT